MATHYDDKQFYATDEKSSDPNIAVTDAYPSEIERHLDERDHELAVTSEGDHGTKRSLPPRVVSMIAIAGTIGTGLLLSSGSALAQGGPVGCFLGYTVMGVFIAFMMYSMGEMMCYAPNIGGFVEMGSKYVNESFGFMMGFNYFLAVGISVPSELSAVAVLISYWDDNTKHAAIYITVFLFLTWGVNMVGVRWYGEVEFVMGVLKIGMIIVLIIFGLVADLGGVKGHKDAPHGRYWREAPFNPNFLGIKPKQLSEFLGFYSVLTKAAFAFSGIECVALIAGEAHNPRKSLRTGIRTVFYRITFLYIVAIVIIGLNIRYDDPDLVAANALGGETAASSPFALIAKRAGVNALAHVVNAITVTSAWSAGNESLYGCARCLMAMTRNGFGFKCFLWTNKAGVPWVGVSIGSAFGLLAYLSVSNGSNTAFEWLSNLTALGTLVNWACISFCFTRFKKACDVQGLDRSKFPLRSWCQPYLAWSATILFSIVIFFSGWKTFVPKFQYQDFIAAYISLPIVALSWIGWTIYRRDRWIPYDQIDLSGGPAAALVGTKYAHQAIA